MLNRLKQNNGYVLPYLLVTILLITTVVAITFNLFFLYNKYEVRKYNKKKLDLACYSAVQQFLAKDSLDLKEKQLFVIDSTKVLLSIIPKGFYYGVTAKAKNRKDSSSVTYVLADRMHEPFDNALVISRTGLNAVVTGNTKITGNILGTTNKVTKGKIAGINPAAENYLEGTVKTSESILPKLFNYNTQANRIFSNSGGRLKQQKGLLLKKNTTIDNYFLAQNDTARQIFIYGDLTLSGKLAASKKTKQIFVSGRTTIEEKTVTNADLEIYCDSTFTVLPEAEIENLLVSVKSKIEIKEGVLCKNVQFISRKGIECKNTVLNYPSILCLYVDPDDTAKQKSAITISSSKINGTVMLLASDIASSKNKSRILIDGKSVVQGLVYSENSVEISSKLIGTLYTYNTVFYKKPTQYINWLVDLNINRKKLDGLFLLPVGFRKNPKLEILKETWEF